MSFISNLFGKIFHRSGEEESTYPVIRNGRRLNPLYNPNKKPERDAFDECDRIMDDFMTARGYRKYLSTSNFIPKPKRRFLKKKEKMEIGDTKVMFGINRFKK